MSNKKNLKEEKRFVCWREEKQGERLTKVPYYVINGKAIKASSTNPNTWGYAPDVIKHTQNPKFNFNGIGIMLGDGLCGIDLDNHVNADGSLSPYAKQIVEEIDSYTEISPSGKGLHILCIAKADKLQGYKNKDSSKRLEVYCKNRYLTYTGKALKGFKKPIQERTPQLIALCERELKKEVLPQIKPQSSTAKQKTTALSDEEIINIASYSKNKEKFLKLWEGNWESDYPSQSEADAALAAILCFYSQEDEQVESLMKESGLYRDKFEREDYLDRTISFARAKQTKQYSPSTPDFDDSIFQIDTENESFEELNPFPIQIFPEPYREFAQQMMDTFNITSEFIGPQILAVCSFLTRNNLFLKWEGTRYFETYPNLFVVIVAASGIGKGISANLLTRPIKEYFKKRSEQWEEEIGKDNRARIERLSLETSALKGQYKKETKKRYKKVQETINQLGRAVSEDSNPIAEKLDSKHKEIEQLKQEKNPFDNVVLKDFTEEALNVAVEQSLGSVFCFSEEASKELNHVLGLQRDTKVVSDKTLISLFSHEDIKENRITRKGASIDLPGGSLLWLTQGVRIWRVMENEELLLGGFLPRIIMAEGSEHPTRTHSIQKKIDDDLKESVYNSMASTLDFFTTSEEVYSIEPEEEAQEKLHYFAQDTDVQIRKETNTILHPFYRRLNEISARVALTLHIMKWGKRACKAPLDATSVQGGIDVANWHKSKIKSFYIRKITEGNKELLDDAIKVVKQLKDKKFIKPVNLYRAQNGGRRLVTNTQAAKKLCDTLVKMGILGEPQKGNTSSLKYPINKNKL